MQALAYDSAMATVEFLFDYASPYSFLANETLGAKLPAAQIVYQPIYLRGLELFAKGIPFTASKLAFLVRDIQRCAADDGIELRVPGSFPINGVYALRGAIAARRVDRFADYHRTMFRAAWQLGRDISRKDTVIAIGAELGIDLAETIDDPTIKDELRATTTAAEKRGVFGAPTFFVGDAMFWGHDRVHQVARALAP